ncbi:MAG: DUF4062 domain-containing protein [Hyphomonadaceae bacterium]|nr:DUF4062 domain-containing protein [Hyphomonadaceae bacterium]
MASAKPTVFLSSTFKDAFGGRDGEIPLRTRILEERLPVRLWAYEHEWPAARETAPLDADTIIDRCFAGIKACDLFVFILSGRYGTGANLIKDGAFSSYLELELFAAAALRKPILVLHYKGRDPAPALIDSMVLLRRAFASGDYCLGSEGELFDRFQEACRALAKGRRAVGRERQLSLSDGLSLKRTQRGVALDLDDPRLKFLDGQLIARHSIDLNRARMLIDQVARGKRNHAGVEMEMPHGASLFRLWAAMRELMTENLDALDDPQTAALWDKALGLWAGKASWFGLHGHVWMGPLAAVNTQSAFRQRRRADRDYADDPTIREPMGARASALYSIAQHVRSIERKLFHFDQTGRLATQAIALDKNAQQGVLAIRGNVSLALGKMGFVSRIWDAAEDFETALKLREKANASPASIGEMQVDLGLTYVLTGRGGKGFTLMQEGVSGLRTNTSANGKSFLARGLRKLSLASLVMMRPTMRRQARAEIAALSAETEALDQARDLNGDEWSGAFKS